MGVLSRAVRNISRRKIRALLVIIALGFCMAIMVSIPAGVTANQESTMLLTQNSMLFVKDTLYVNREVPIRKIKKSYETIEIGKIKR